MNNPIHLSEDDFDRRYPLRVNHLDPNASWVIGEGPGCLFATYGEELEFIRRQEPTLLDGDDGSLLLVNGMHYVNRIGYLLSTVPIPAGRFIEVRIETNLET